MTASTNLYLTARPTVGLSGKKTKHGGAGTAVGGLVLPELQKVRGRTGLP